MTGTDITDKGSIELDNNVTLTGGARIEGTSSSVRGPITNLGTLEVAGAATLLVERPAPDVLADAVAEHGVTVLFTAPTAYRAMLAAGRERWRRDGGQGLRVLSGAVTSPTLNAQLDRLREHYP